MHKTSTSTTASSPEETATEIPSDFLNPYQLDGEALKIITYPHPTLAMKATPVVKFDQELVTLCKNMLFTMYKANGIGLAAPQVNISSRIFVIDVQYEREKVYLPNDEEIYRLQNFQPMVFINPTFRDMEGSIVYQEGCLSLPGVYEDVERFEHIFVDFFDMYGQPQTIEAHEIFAICLQHENDHLDGLVLLDRLGKLKQKFLKDKLLKRKKRTPAK